MGLSLCSKCDCRRGISTIFDVVTIARKCGAASRHSSATQTTDHESMSYVPGALKQYPAVFKEYIRQLSEVRFWLSKWLVAATLLGGILVIGLVLVMVRHLDFDTFLNYFALGLLIFVVVTLFYGIIAIHDVPYEIAKHRDHPHQDAIHAAGWVSLFTLHVMWPFLWIWAMLYRPDRGWGFRGSQTNEVTYRVDGVEELSRRVAELERRISQRTH
jgi:uncharacterized protein DUF3302